MALELIDQTVLTDIANAIRERNGTETTYKPSEMATAVLALDGTKAGAGTTVTLPAKTGVISDPDYVESRQSLHSTADVTNVWEVSTEGYSSYTDLPWHSERNSVKKLYIDSLVASVEWPNVSYPAATCPM